MCSYPNEMTYNGNLLFHYTSLDNAIKIILTNSLRFGSFENTNDITESRRSILSNVPGKNKKKVEKEISEYHAICFTKDNDAPRGFAVDCMWGYYAEKGNGVCLVFEKDKLLAEYARITHLPKAIDNTQEYDVHYCDNSNLIHLDSHTVPGARKELKENIRNFFFVKDNCWKHENEFRLLVKSEEPRFLPLSDSLMGAIICAPAKGNYKETLQYKLLSELEHLRTFNIYNYGYKLGNRELYLDDEPKCPILGDEYQIDDSETLLY